MTSRGARWLRLAFRYEGYDVITLEKLIDREFTLPELQTAQEVISFYAKRIAADVKLPAQFSALAPKVREFLTTHSKRCETSSSKSKFPSLSQRDA